MTENEAIERLQCMRLFMEINDRQNDSKFLKDDYIANKMAIKALEEIQQYRAIGTIEEIKALKKKSIPRKIKGIQFEEAICPRCESELFDTYWAFGGIHYCSNCGQTIDWQ